MYRACFDSIDPAAIPPDAPMLLYYVDGRYGPSHADFGTTGWDQAALDRFPRSIKVGVAVFASTNAGTVGDCETFDMSPMGLVLWVVNRRKMGIDPTGYCSLSRWQECRDAFAQANVPEPHWLIASYDGDPTIPEGAIGKQFADSSITGRNLDVSSIADYWPGVDALPAPPAPPPLTAGDGPPIGRLGLSVLADDGAHHQS